VNEAYFILGYCACIRRSLKGDGTGNILSPELADAERTANDILDGGAFSPTAVWEMQTLVQASEGETGMTMEVGLGIGGRHRRRSRRTDIWLTPLSLVRSLGAFDLDPCGAPDWYTATRLICPPEDGLIADWALGRVWLNPPYGRQTGMWIRKLADHGDGIALIFSRTETDFFHRWVWPKATAFLFLRGRINFHHRDGTRSRKNAGGPSVLVAYGERNAEALRACGLKGAFLLGGR
jgi:hypothetical protein